MLGKDATKRIEKVLSDASREYFLDTIPDITFPEDINISLQVTKDPKNGDLTSNVAMRLASLGKVSPVAMGQGIVDVFKTKIQGTPIGRIIEDRDQRRVYQF